MNHNDSSSDVSRNGHATLITAKLATMLVAAFVFAALSSAPAFAQTAPTSSNGDLLVWSKIADDLEKAINAPATPAVSWAKNVNGTRMLKVLIVSSSTDPDMAALRSEVLARGGAVYLRFISVAALSAMLPASQVAGIASRPDVQSISPNRLTARTASLLETTVGATTSAVRTSKGNGHSLNYTGLDGTGIGIAILDSGIATSHNAFKGKSGPKDRVVASVDFQKVGDATLSGAKDWTPGIDTSTALVPGSAAQDNYEARLDNSTANPADLYGHGSHVASVAAGFGKGNGVDNTGVAPGASLYDIKVIDANGYGQISDVIAGIDWAIYHAREYNIRVLNLSLASDSTETWQTDPLAKAVRSAVAAGITVVVAAGNFGRNAAGSENYGTVSSPGHDPSVITVGSANSKSSAARSDDTVNFFSSRGPTRGSYVDWNGTRQVDNLIKPDLVAPGNKIIGVMATGDRGKALNYLATTYPMLKSVSGADQSQNYQLMYLSGTSVAAPAVAGAVALMLQANPGLTPPLIKAILQYTAQPIENANLLQQGAGLLNVDGAVRLAQSLRTDVSTAIDAGSISAGSSLLAAGKTLPSPSSTINGEIVNWSRIAYVGGNRIMSGPTLFTQFQPIYDPRLVWARNRALKRTVTYWPASRGVAASTFVKSIVESSASSQALLTAGVVDGTDLTGASSMLAHVGLFTPTASLAGWLANNGGKTLATGIVVSNGLVLSEGLVLAEGMVLSERMVVSEGLVLAEGICLSEGMVIGEFSLIGE